MEQITALKWSIGICVDQCELMDFIALSLPRVHICLTYGEDGEICKVSAIGTEEELKVLKAWILQ